MGRSPGAGGGAGGSGCCRYSCGSVQLLLRRRLLPPRRTSGVARKGRTPAPLPLRGSQVSSSLRRRRGRGPRPAPARQPSAPPKPYLSLQVWSAKRARAGRGAPSGREAAPPRVSPRAASLSLSAVEAPPCCDLVAVVTLQPEHGVGVRGGGLG